MGTFRTSLAILFSLALTGAARGSDRVVICHHAGPTKVFEIEVSASAVPGHMRHGDTVGPCGGGGET